MFSQDQSIYTFLTFPGTAEAALHFYTSLFEDSEILTIGYFKEGQPGEVGKVMNAQFNIKGQAFMAMDMEKKFLTDFSWATSIFVRCEDEAEFDRLFAAFSKGGSVMMGPEPVNGLRKVAWVTDSYGVTWQLVWE
ncbi:VOC family protein [Carnobacterium gallinarum]|uniref:VOC family protein n=1 Tax=Carnobacterium gallinarum TaxID=2749 RepID=UPI0005566DCE|nr:VOC family protein [Carnobacterium gallinarum]